MHCPNCQNTDILYGSSQSVHVLRVLIGSQKRYCPVCHEKWRVRTKGSYKKNYKFYLVTLPTMLIAGMIFLKLTGSDSMMRNDFMYSHFGMGSPRQVSLTQKEGEDGVFGFGSSEYSKNSNKNGLLGKKGDFGADDLFGIGSSGKRSDAHGNSGANKSGRSKGMGDNLRARLLEEARQAGIPIPQNIENISIDKMKNFARDSQKMSKLSSKQRKFIEDAMGSM